MGINLFDHPFPSYTKIQTLANHANTALKNIGSEMRTTTYLLIVIVCLFNYLLDLATSKHQVNPNLVEIEKIKQELLVASELCKAIQERKFIHMHNLDFSVLATGVIAKLNTENYYMLHVGSPKQPLILKFKQKIRWPLAFV